MRALLLNSLLSFLIFEILAMFFTSGLPSLHLGFKSLTLGSIFLFVSKCDTAMGFDSYIHCLIDVLITTSQVVCEGYTRDSIYALLDRVTLTSWLESEILIPKNGVASAPRTKSFSHTVRFFYYIQFYTVSYASPNSFFIHLLTLSIQVIVISIYF